MLWRYFWSLLLWLLGSIFAYYFGDYIICELRVILSILDIFCIGWVGWGVSILLSCFTMLSDLVLGILHWVLLRDEW